MEEQAAHELYTEFAAVDAGARFKQGIGFAGRGAPRELQGWADKDDDDVIARNRRLFGGDRGRQDERTSPEYDSDTAEAVQRRLRALKKEQRPQQAEAPAPLPERLYDERREQRQLRHSQQERPAAEERRNHSGSRHRQRQRSRSRERRRSRSRSWERRRSRSRGADRHRRRHADNSRHRQRSRSREREHGRRHDDRTLRRSRSPRGRVSRDERQVQERGRDSGRAGGGGSSGAAAAAAAGGGSSGLQKLDFEALIPGYSAMTAPQKLKAKTQYLLERSEAKDRKQQERGREEEGGADQQQWTRFKFSDAAELEEHRLQPAAVYGEANEEAEDVKAAGLGGLSAVTFKQSNAAAVQQERDDLHSAAIFGGGGGGGGGKAGGGAAPAATERPAGAGAAWPRQAQAAAAAAAGRHRQHAAAEEPGGRLGRGGESAARSAGSEEDLWALAEAEGAVVVPAAEVAAVLHQPQPAAPASGGSRGGGGLSWRERALAAKRAKQQQ